MGIVGNDYKKWLQTLGIDSGTQKQQDTFNALHSEFQTALSSEITVEVVQQICQTVVDPDEFYDLVRNQAKKLARMGGDKKLGESSSEEEELGGLDGLGGLDAF